MSGTTDPPDTDDSSFLLSRRPYALYLTGRFLGTLATGSQSVAIAWEVYELARQTMSLPEAAFAVGMIGLAQFLPLFALTLVAGETADRHDRRRILILCYLAQLLISAGLAFRSALGGGLWPIFALAGLFGCARAFFQPTASALGPMLVPLRLLPRAIATNSLAFQLASILGPALGGLLCVVSPVLGYAVSAGLYAAAASCALLIRADTRPPFDAARSRVAQIREGLVYLWGNKLVLGAISLDLFAVLLGGATGLLPVFARDVLEVGPQGFGILRGPVGRGPFGGRVSRTPADPHPSGREDARGSRSVRVDDRGVRLLPIGSSIGVRPGGARRRRHGVDVYPSELGTDHHPGPDAWTCLGGRDVVHRGVERTGRIRERGYGPDTWTGRVRGVRWRRGNGCDSDLGLAVPAAAQGGSVGMRIRSHGVSGAHTSAP